MFVTKGSRVRARWLRADSSVFAGVMPKVGAETVEVTGVVRHVRGESPDGPASGIFIDADVWDGETVTPLGCTCGPHVLVRPEWIEAAS